MGLSFYFVWYFNCSKKNIILYSLGGYPHPKGMFAEKIPDWLTLYCERIGKLKVFEKAKYTQPNHILINEYPPGIGIMVF